MGTWVGGVWQHRAMVSPILTPWLQRQARAADHPVTHPDENAPTPILDWGHPAFRALAAPSDAPLDARAYLQELHLRLSAQLRPVYSVRERRRASQTLRTGRGSCSQRLAVLEAAARSHGIATRVHGLLLDGRFWYPRAPRYRRLIPDQVVLAWPEFWIEREWVSVSELHGPATALAEASKGRRFTNTGGETLFEAIGQTAVDWLGVTADCAHSCDLSAVVLRDLGHYPSRDALFDAVGETFCMPVRPVVDIVASRMGAR